MGKKIIIGVSFLTLLWIVSCKNNNKGETQKPVERFAFFGDSNGADNYILANEALSK
ncbi:MAG: hypothetical protein IT239_05335, partial [Bacteroidia bacterium]|nr:hypothetical protein [Bacteroidia bacterium]